MISTIVVVVVAELVDVHCLCDDEFRLGGFELFEDLGGGVEWIGGGGDGADHGGGEEGEDEFRRVLEEDHDDVALVDAELGETGGDLPGHEVGLGVGVGFSGGADDEAGTVGDFGKLLEAVGVEGKVVGNGYVW